MNTRTEDEYRAAACAAARAHGFLKAQLQFKTFESGHKEQAEDIVNEIAKTIWPGDESMEAAE